jgi:hypothetical protein
MTSGKKFLKARVFKEFINPSEDIYFWGFVKDDDSKKISK